MTNRNSMMAGVAVLIASATGAPSAYASSHREAPLISTDPCADNNDTYAWVTPGAHDKLNLVGTYIPLEEPSGGPNFHMLCDDVMYTFNITRGALSLDPVLRYVIQVHTQRGPNVDEANLGLPVGGGKEFFIQITGLRQTFSVFKETIAADGRVTRTNIVENQPVAPPNIGPQTFTVAGYATLPRGGSTETSYTDAYASAFITPMGPGAASPRDGSEGRAWVGPRDDGFYVDLGGIFDLANILTRGKGIAQDGVAGFNTHAIVLEIPTTKVTADGQAPGNTETNDRTFIGVYAANYRQKASVLRNNGTKESIGPWTRVSRLGLPLINEAVIGYNDKDYWNRLSPKEDVQVFGGYFLFPVIVRDAEVVGIYQALHVDPTPFKGGTTGRTDILDIINLKDNVHSVPIMATGDVLRLDLATDSSFPNGRSLVGGGNAGKCGDPQSTAPCSENVDVTDILLSVLLAGAPSGVGDGVDYNDKPFLTQMPWLPLPWSGWNQGHGKTTP